MSLMLSFRIRFRRHLCHVCFRRRNFATLISSNFERLLPVVIFLVVLPAICIQFSISHSIYHVGYTWLRHYMKPSSDLADEIHFIRQLVEENKRRTEDAKAFVADFVENWDSKPFDSFSSDILDSNKKPEIETYTDPVRILIAILTARREIFVDNDLAEYESNYLTQNVAEFWRLGVARLEKSSNVEYRMIVCSATSVTQHETEEERDWRRFLDLFKAPDYVSDNPSLNLDYDRMAWIYEKEKRDYVNCLRQAALDSPSAGYILIVEDDAIPRPEALHVIERLVTGNWFEERSRSEQFPGVDSKTYFKLFQSVRRGANFDLDSLFVSTAYSVVFGSIVFVVVQTFPPSFGLNYKWFKRSSVIKATGSTMRQASLRRSTWLKCSVYALGVVLVLGQSTVEGWRAVVTAWTGWPLHHITSDVECCTQAILFSRDAATDVAAFMDTIHCNESFHKSDALWTYQTTSIESDVESARGYLIQPNLFNHIGLFSSIKHKLKDPQTIIYNSL